MREIPAGWRRAGVSPVSKKGSKGPGTSSLSASSPPREMEQLILDAIPKQLGEKKVMRSNQHGLQPATKGKSHCTSLEPSAMPWPAGGWGSGGCGAVTSARRWAPSATAST